VFCHDLLAFTEADGVLMALGHGFKARVGWLPVVLVQCFCKCILHGHLHSAPLPRGPSMGRVLAALVQTLVSHLHRCYCTQYSCRTAQTSNNISVSQ
jgi:hypothetical protein